MLNYFVFQVIKWAYWGKYPPLISSEPGEGGENWINLDFSFSWHWLACNFITDHREFDIQIRSGMTTPCLASTVSNYMPAAGHRKIMRRESQKVGLCSAQVISQPEHFTQLNPGAIVHNLSLYLARHPPLSVPSTAFILVNLEHFYTTFQNTAVKFRIHVSEWIGSRSLFVIHDVSVSRFSIKFNLQSNSRHVSDRVTSVQDFGKMYQSSNFLIWPLLSSGCVRRYK